MKKVFLFFSLVVFSFVLAVSAQAAVSITTILPIVAATPTIDQRDTVNIVWTSGTAKSDIYINKVVSLTDNKIVATTTIAKGAVSPYSWLVSKNNTVVGGVYKIKVCQLNTSICDVSISFTVNSGKLTTQTQVLDLFKSALGSRYNSLNRDGRNGISDLMIMNTGSARNPTYRISTSTVNSVNAYRKSGKELLVWFGDQFKLPANQAVLNTAEKTNIGTAIIDRLKDFCTNDYNAGSNSLKLVYTNGLIAAERDKQSLTTGIGFCNKTYSDRMAIVRGYSELVAAPYSVPAAQKDNLSLKAAYLYIETEEARLAKENCVNNAYRTYFTTANTGAIALRDALQTGYIAGTGPQAVYVTCLSAVAWAW